MVIWTAWPETTTVTSNFLSGFGSGLDTGSSCSGGAYLPIGVKWPKFPLGAADVGDPRPTEGMRKPAARARGPTRSSGRLAGAVQDVGVHVGAIGPDDRADLLVDA